MKNLMIREMTPADLSEVVEIEQQLFTQPWSRQGFLSSLQQQDTLYLVAQQDGKVAGYCGLLQSFDEADITNVAVHPEYRRLGIACQMLEQLMEQGGTRGIQRYTLEVRVSNTAAVKLYQKLGFASVGIRKNFYAFPTEDAMIMWTE